MGYNVTLTDSKFFIADEDKRAAFKALKERFTFKEARCLEEALEAFSYTPEVDEEDNIVGIDRWCEKLGYDEDEMFSIIAPFVKSGSYIEMLGEDGERWRWIFNDGTVEEKQAKTIWE